MLKIILTLSFMLGCMAKSDKSSCAYKVTEIPPDPKSGCCGVDSSGNKVSDGLVAKIDQYPWEVLIEYEKNDALKALCGGVLISGKYVLTSAHCITAPAFVGYIPKSIRLGEYDTSNEGPDCVKTADGKEDCTEGSISIPIDETIRHPDHDREEKKNDIALIRMTETAPYTDFIRPICLPGVTINAEDLKLKLAGWFALNDDEEISTKKNHIDLPFVDREQCNQLYTNTSIFRPPRPLSKTQLCAGGVKGKNACRSGSGQTLTLLNGENYEAVGIASYGPLPCGDSDVPDVFTNVYEFLPWIKSSIS